MGGVFLIWKQEKKNGKNFLLTNRNCSYIMTKLISAIAKIMQIWRRNSAGRVPGSYPVCHLFESGRRYQARWSSG